MRLSGPRRLLAALVLAATLASGAAAAEASFYAGVVTEHPGAAVEIETGKRHGHKAVIGFDWGTVPFPCDSNPDGGNTISGTRELNARVRDGRFERTFDGALEDLEHYEGRFKPGGRITGEFKITYNDAGDICRTGKLHWVVHRL